MTGNVLKKLMAERNLTQVQLAKELGVSRQSVARWLNNYPIDNKNLLALSKFFNISEASLRYGAEPTRVSAYDTGDTPPEDVVIIHEYRLSFGASPAGVEATPEWEIVEDGDDFWYKRSFFQKRHLNPERCKRARVTGDSMEPTICGGDTFLFYEEIDSRPGCVIIADGQIYAISVDGQLKVKRLSKSKDGIVVRSDNSNYDAEIYAGDDLNRLRIFGKVVEINRAF